VNSHTLHNSLLQAVLTAAVESGYDQVLCTPSTAAQVAKWQELASFNPLNLQPDGIITDAEDQQVSSSSSNWVLGLVVSGGPLAYTQCLCSTWHTMRCSTTVSQSQTHSVELSHISNNGKATHSAFQTLPSHTSNNGEGITQRLPDPIKAV
jgi:hypothetical protein